MPYAVRCDGVAEGLVIELAPELLESIARAHAHGRTELRPAICVRDPVVVHLAHALESDLHAGVPAGRTYGESIAAALAAHLVRWHSEHAPRSLESGRLPKPLRRIALAKELLRQPTLTIAEIALRCGFASQSNFATVFKRIAKVSPDAYRKGFVK